MRSTRSSSPGYGFVAAPHRPPHARAHSVVSLRPAQRLTPSAGASSLVPRAAEPQHG